MELTHATLLVCPTLNSGNTFDDWISACKSQTIRPLHVLIIDSSSTDDTVRKARTENYDIHIIDRGEFDHGATRNYAWKNYAEFAYVVYLTQDAILTDSASIKKILLPFEDSDVAAVCGRQLPRTMAGAIETHARLFNYPAESRVCSIEDSRRLGLKTAFLSNSFAAYRLSALKEVGGFPDDVIFGEDMYIAAKLLKTGYKVAYAADACVYHSHDYTLIEEFRRYFDMGVFHAREPWIRRDFGAAESEGLKYVMSEMGYLSRHAFWRIPEALLRTVLKYTGFRLGRAEHYIPLNIKRIMSMNSGYFKTD